MIHRQWQVFWVGLSDENLSTVFRDVSNPSEREVLRRVQKRSTEDEIKYEDVEQYIGAHSNPSHQFRAGTWQAGQQGP